MSKPKDPRDVAIDYVMSEPLPIATQFVQMLASIVKSRGKSKPAATTPTKASTAARPRGPQRVVSEVDPSATPAPLPMGEEGPREPVAK